MAHYLQFLTFLLCVILLVLLLPLQDHQEMMIIKTDSKFFWIVAGKYEWQYRWCLSCWTACFWPIPFIYQILYSSQRAADKIYCGCSLLYDWIRSTIWCSWEPMLLPIQITLSLWKEGLHILTIKISNKFFFQNSISFILGCFTKFRHYKKLQQATKRQMWRRGRFLELSRLLNQREGARGVMTIGNARLSSITPDLWVE